MKISYIKVLGSILLLMIICVYVYKSNCLELLAKAQGFDTHTALLALSIAYLLSNLFLLPFGLPLTLLAGVLWGTFAGGLLINFLATFVAGVSFFIGRKLGHNHVDNFLKKFDRLDRFRNMLQRYDWQFIALARINPVVPFGISNYLFGTIPNLSFKRYIIVTAISNLFPCLAFASIGSVFKSFSLLESNVNNVIFEISIASLAISLLFVLKTVILAKMRGN